MEVSQAFGSVCITSPVLLTIVLSSLVGFAVVLLFLPETAKLSLEELDMGKSRSI